MEIRKCLRRRSLLFKGNYYYYYYYYYYCHHDKTVTFITFITIVFLPCYTNYSQEPNASIFMFTTYKMIFNLNTYQYKNIQSLKSPKTIQ